jgi:hypothetical protein
MTCRMTDKPKMQTVLAKKECVPQKANDELKKNPITPRNIIILGKECAITNGYMPTFLLNMYLDYDGLDNFIIEYPFFTVNRKLNIITFHSCIYSNDNVKIVNLKKN